MSSDVEWCHAIRVLTSMRSLGSFVPCFSYSAAFSRVPKTDKTGNQASEGYLWTHDRLHAALSFVRTWVKKSSHYLHKLLHAFCCETVTSKQSWWIICEQRRMNRDIRVEHTFGEGSPWFSFCGVSVANQAMLWFSITLAVQSHSGKKNLSIQTKKQNQPMTCSHSLSRV